MWIICTPFPSVPAEGASTWVYPSQSQDYERSAGLNGSPLQSKSWLRAWKRNRWLRRLSGRTCEPSTANRGVESWISSLVVTRASRSVSPVNVLDRMILDTCGPTSLASLMKWNQQSVFSRTCPVTCRLDSTKWQKTWKQWISQLRRACLTRKKYVLHKKDYAYSFLLWRTPTSFDHKIGSALPLRSDRQIVLAHQVQRWAIRFPRRSTTTWHGARSLRINTRFTAWLMGWPPITQDSAVCSATAWCRYRQRMRSALCGLLCAFNPATASSTAA